MKSISISLILDTLLSFAISALILFCVFELSEIPHLISIPILIIVSLIIAIAFSIRSLQKSKKQVGEKITSTKKRILSEKLALMTKSQINELFKGLFLKSLKNFAIKDDYIEFENYLVFLVFHLDAITLRDAVEIYKSQSNDSIKQVVIISSAFSSQVMTFAKEHNLKLIGIDEVFELIENYRPEFLNLTVKSKRKLNYSLICTKKFGKRFIFYGIALDLMSFIAFYPTYYLIVGTAFIIFGLIVAFFGKKTYTEGFSFEKLN